MRHYILNERGEPEACDDIVKYAIWHSKADRENLRTVAKTRLPKVLVSTVFLGIDHNFRGEGPPVLWETMIFADDDSGYAELDESCERYSSLDAALAGHRAMVAKLGVN